MVWMIQKNIQKRLSWNVNFEKVKEKHSVYKKLVCIGREWRKEVISGRRQIEEREGEKGNSMKKWEILWTDGRWIEISV